MLAEERAAALRVLICADAVATTVLAPWVDKLGAEISYARDVNECLSLLGVGRQDAILLWRRNEMDLRRLIAACKVPVVVVDESPAVEEAVRVMRDGAHSYVAPGNALLDAMRDVTSQVRPELVRPRWTDVERALLGRIISRSPAMSEVMERLRAIARTPSTTALVLGESGVGKELIASAIHGLSDRASKPFVPVDCSAIPETLIESELFGHERGAFTGAVSEQKGRFEMADGGTLFLDEIGELPLVLQGKLLRALEEKQIWRVGTTLPRKVDVRVVAATNRDLRAMVHGQTFRADLYYRLSVFLISVPPLRERGADVLHLADHFVARFNRELGREVTSLSPAARAKLIAYPFPGNVRELRNIIEEAMVSASGAVLGPSDLKLPAFSAVLERESASGSPEVEQIPVQWGEGALARLEREAIQRAMAMTQGNQTQAAALLGIQRLALARALQRHGLKAPGKRGRPVKSTPTDL